MYAKLMLGVLFGFSSLMVSLQGEIINHGMMHACAKITPIVLIRHQQSVCVMGKQRDAK